MATPTTTKKRWTATTTYRTSESGQGVNHLDFDEIVELDHWIEAGPHWGTIEKVEITYNHGDGKLTVEDAEKL